MAIVSSGQEVGGLFELNVWPDTSFFEYAKSLSPSNLDLEIRSLPLPYLAPFLHTLTQRLKSHKDFEAVQALLAVFLRVRGEALVRPEDAIDPFDPASSSGMSAQKGSEREAVRLRLGELKEEQKKESRRLTELVGYAMGTLGFLRSSG
jgi:U3 small nucleolar RNA-associated protein 21